MQKENEAPAQSPSTEGQIYCPISIPSTITTKKTLVTKMSFVKYRAAFLPCNFVFPGVQKTHLFFICLFFYPSVRSPFTEVSCEVPLSGGRQHLGACAHPWLGQHKGTLIIASWLPACVPSLCFSL